MSYQLIELSYEQDLAIVTMNNVKRRNALSLAHMQELTSAFREVGESQASGVLLAANGAVFCSGHDLSEMVDQDVSFMSCLLETCTTLMNTIQEIPQPVLACVQGVATAAGCQLVATCDLAVAATTASFATPGVKIGWFCTTPMVALSRNIGHKRALEMLFTGDPITAQTAADWGLINRAVAVEQLRNEALRLLRAASNNSVNARSIGKQAFYTQIDLPQPQAYEYAQDVMASASQIPDASEGMHAFLEKRQPHFDQRTK
ncbi:enoyl-CoA hydratase-related protein [Dictyobacter kobayashii]|uniref:Enoyl-CoA hydratase domain-containing protein 3, mitochondrial n=1 Tax=Dictyobacter kobayashii TaxID=2014872 RepID=A0A402AU33_9CHLR|nr:enoyl-CoA hydratase-related protein [Dictyobacter kobayashii]GCE22618.1 enoyl-CoA hydratase [Dictyobacter kobayashii]